MRATWGPFRPVTGQRGPVSARPPTRLSSLSRRVAPEVSRTLSQPVQRLTVSYALTCIRVQAPWSVRASWEKTSWVAFVLVRAQTTLRPPRQLVLGVAAEVGALPL